MQVERQLGKLRGLLTGMAKDPEFEWVLVLSTTQDPKGAEALDLVGTKDPEPEQAPIVPIATVLEAEQVSNPIVTKESTEAATSSVITGMSCLTPLWIVLVITAIIIIIIILRSFPSLGLQAKPAPKSSSR